MTLTAVKRFQTVENLHDIILNFPPRLAARPRAPPGPSVHRPSTTTTAPTHSWLYQYPWSASKTELVALASGKMQSQMIMNYFILSLLAIANYYYVLGSDSAVSLPLSLPSTQTFADDREDWRKFLPEKLRDSKGAPLHKIIIETTSNPSKTVTVYLLGTSHVSRTSCEDAKLLMEYARPGERKNPCFFLISIDSHAITLQKQMFSLLSCARIELGY